MSISEILTSIDREIAQLKQARALLGAGSSRGSSGTAGTSKKVAIKSIAAKTVKRKKRNLTPEGRRRIAEAQKQRWEAQRKAAAASQK
jgi:hypothetical protein